MGSSGTHAASARNAAANTTLSFTPSPSGPVGQKLTNADPYLLLE
jgi:hypothetical protein